jgi:hypothetical protein
MGFASLNPSYKLHATTTSGHEVPPSHWLYHIKSVEDFFETAALVRITLSALKYLRKVCSSTFLKRA